MADDKKTLEMRVAELEDKLAKLHISEEDMATYQKVAAKLGTGGITAGPSAGTAAIQCISPVVHCVIRDCIRPIIRNPIYWADCIPQCAPGGGFGGGGFGGFGGG